MEAVLEEGPAAAGYADQRRRHACRGMIAVDDDEQSAYYAARAARAALTARYGHLGLTFTPALVSASGQREASWAGGQSAPAPRTSC
jgi:hypothetical protein